MSDIRLRDAFIEAARAYCVSLDVYDIKSTPLNMRKMTVARIAMRDAYKALDNGVREVF